MSDAPTYDKLREFLPKLADMQPDDGADQRTIDAAIKFSFMFEQAGTRCPQIFWHGGNAIVFDWGGGTMLTICGGWGAPHVR